jgi:hypothetical protein
MSAYSAYALREPIVARGPADRRDHDWMWKVEAFVTYDVEALLRRSWQELLRYGIGRALAA